MSVKVTYTTSAIAVGGRDGITGTSDGRFEVKLARPKALGGKADGANPEQLFASATQPAFSTPCSSRRREGGPGFRRMPR
jgi:lipoyl-dependent peroxiredoxin